MGIIKKAIVAFCITLFFTGVFAFFNEMGAMQANIGSSLFFPVFFAWVSLEVVFSTM